MRTHGDWYKRIYHDMMKVNESDKKVDDNKSGDRLNSMYQDQIATSNYWKRMHMEEKSKGNS